MDTNVAHNPYIPSTASLGDGVAPHKAEGCWRDGALLVVTHASRLPPRCVKCNAPVDVPIKEKKLYSHHPGIYLLFLVNVLLYLIVALIKRKTVTVSPALCVEHAKRRKLGIAIAWGGLTIGLLTIASGFAQRPMMAIVGILVIAGSVITGMLMARMLYPKMIDERGAHLKGAGEDFLNSIPSTTDWIRM